MTKREVFETMADLVRGPSDDAPAVQRISEQMLEGLRPALRTLAAAVATDRLLSPAVTATRMAIRAVFFERLVRFRVEMALAVVRRMQQDNGDTNADREYESATNVALLKLFADLPGASALAIKGRE